MAAEATVPTSFMLYQLFPGILRAMTTLNYREGIERILVVIACCWFIACCSAGFYWIAAGDAENAGTAFTAAFAVPIGIAIAIGLLVKVLRWIWSGFTGPEANLPDE